MKKALVLVLLLTLGLYLAAETTFSTKGVLRTRTAMYNYFGEDAPTHSYIDSRLRMSFIGAFSEKLKAVWQVEVGDVKWGKESTGGDLDTDGINVETKHAYLNFICPNSGVDITVGLQRFEDHNSLVMGADFAAFMFAKNFDFGKVQFGTGKIYEGDYTEDDDDDLFFLNYYGKNFGIENILRRQMGGDWYDIWFMPYFVYQMNDLIFDLQAIYNYGSYTLADEYRADDEITNGGYGVNLKIKYAKDFKLGFEVLYVSGDDGEDSESTSVFNTILEYNFNGLEIYGRGIHDGQQIGWNGPGNGAMGAMNFILTGEYPIKEDLKLKAAFGYLNTVEENANEETNLGMEADLGICWKIYQPLTFDLVGAYAMPNEDFYDDSDSVYELSSRIQYKF
ncbi:MAG: hypothetical protein JW996_02770 [Candidatus Cloacimonetes bacterium]|nr:hypothetical protein [Candidatus Cloacimonadota bacterium]